MPTFEQLLDRWVGPCVAGNVALILILTLFPYDFSRPKLAAEGHALLFVLRLGPPQHLGDWPANILLFFPLGFGLAGLAKKKALERFYPLVLVVSLTAGLSLTVELLQALLPTRDSSVADVVVNTIGGVLGSLCFSRWGQRVLSHASALAEKTGGLLSRKRLAATFLAYAILAFVLPLPLRRATSFVNWDDSFPLLFGNGPGWNHPWQGKITRAEITDRAISDEAAKSVAEKEDLSSIGTPLIASYQFRDAGRLSDQAGRLPDLVWKGQGSGGYQGDGVVLAGGSWLETVGPAAALANELQRTNQFTLYVICSPANTLQKGPARIVAFSLGPDYRNFALGQDGEKLIFRLRTPFTGEFGTPPQLEVPGVFNSTDLRRLLITYDGITLRLYVNGSYSPYSLRLSPGPGITIMSYLTPLDPQRLREYSTLYYVWIFVPLGCLLAGIVRKSNPPSTSALLLMGSGTLLPAGVLELILSGINCQPINSENLLLATFLSALPAVCLAYGHRLVA